MSVYNEVGEKLREIREGLNMSKAEAGRRVGVDRTTIHYWEVGGRAIPLDKFITICGVYNVDWCELLRSLPCYRGL